MRLIRLTHGITNNNVALPPKLLAGGTSGVTGLSTVYVPALPLPALVDTFTNPVVAPVGTVNTICVLDALVTVAATPFTVTVLLIAVGLNPVPTIVTLDPVFPCEGAILDTVTPPLPPLDVGVYTITGLSWVLSFVAADVPVMMKSITSPLETACVNEYGYDTPYDMV